MNLTAKQQLSRNPQTAGYSNPTKTYTVPAVTNEDGTISVPAQPVFGIDPNHEPIDLYMAVRSIPSLGNGLKVRTYAAGAIGAAGVSFSVPVGVRYLMLASVADITTSGTVGNRILTTKIVDGTTAAVKWQGANSAAVVASKVAGYDVQFGGGSLSTTVRKQLAAVANTDIQVREVSTLVWMNPTDVINLDDNADIDNADVVSWNLTFVEYAV